MSKQQKLQFHTLKNIFCDRSVLHLTFSQCVPLQRDLLVLLVEAGVSLRLVVKRCASLPLSRNCLCFHFLIIGNAISAEGCESREP